MLKTKVDAQRRLQAIFEQTAVGLAEFDLDGRFVLVNDRYCEMVGRTRGELLGGLRMQDITHPEDLPSNLERFGRLVADGAGFVIEKRYLRPDGSHVWVRNTVSRIDDPGGPSYVLAVAQDISEKVAAEAALRQSEARYRRIFETAGVSLWESDFSAAIQLLDRLREQGVTDLRAHLDEHPQILLEAVRAIRIVDVNDETVRLFNARDKDHLMTSLEAVLVDESLDRFKDDLVAIFEGRDTITGPAELQTIDGERRYVIFAMRIPRDGNNLASVPVALIDQTEQRNAEADAQRLRTDLYRMLMQAPVPIALLSGPDLVFELANPAYLDVVARREIEGKPLREALPELEGQGYDDFLYRVMTTGEPAKAEEAPVRLERDGELTDTYLTFIYAPLRNEAGVADRVMAICMDVTSQVVARQEHERLLAAEHSSRTEAEAARGRFVDLVQGLDAIVWEAEAATFRFTFVSQRAEQILGYPVERWLEEPRFWSDHIHPEDRSWAVDLCVACTADGRDHEFEYRMIAAGGKTVWLRDLVHVVKNEDGEPRLLRGVMVDITERKQAEEARDAFVGVLSHELRTPVTTILGAAELLRKRDVERDERVRSELLGDISAEAGRLSRLVEDLLVLSRRERGQLNVDAEPVLVQHAIRSTVHAEAERYADVEFVADIPPLPPVAADRTYVDQILRNLLSNAAKYGPEGPAEVHVTAAHEDDTVVVRVADSGDGFRPEDEERLFDLFYRARSAQRRPGAGIGLYVTKALVEAMGGQLWAKRLEPRGSEFGFALPVMGSAVPTVRRVERVHSGAIPVSQE